MQKSLTDVDLRLREFELRPKAIANLTSMINHTLHFLALVKKNFTGTGDQFIFTEVDTDSFERLLNETSVCTQHSYSYSYKYYGYVLVLCIVYENFEI